ncbi:MAG TPA: hypothetical protein VEH06_08340 [Candidatus Bathyarchaeia archaeon]|nr:hypothetical protein [Candidatus Bathyarchaeia archaeon]
MKEEKEEINSNNNSDDNNNSMAISNEAIPSEKKDFFDCKFCIM